VRLKSKNAVSSTPQCDGVSGGRLDCLADFWFLRLDTQTEAASSSADIVGAWGRCSSLESAREAARREGWLEASEELEVDEADTPSRQGGCTVKRLGSLGESGRRCGGQGRG